MFDSFYSFTQLIFEKQLQPYQKEPNQNPELTINETQKLTI